MRAVLAFLLVLASIPPCTCSEDERNDPGEFVAWARGHAVKLDSLDHSRTDPAAFDFLDKALEGKRIVCLGETDHFVAERIEFRLMMIRELARRGFRRIGMEMGLSDAKRIDRFFETGDEAWLRKVALFGYRGDMRDDRKDEVRGWTDDAESEFLGTVLAESEWFLRELRGINEEMRPGEPRLEWFGFDLSFRPGGGYTDAAGILAPHAGNPLADSVKEKMVRVPGESRLEEADRLDALIAWIDARRDALSDLLGGAGALELRRSLARMADAFRFIEELQGLDDFDPEVVGEALAVREKKMCRNFDEYLSEWPPGEKIILLGHALHLSKDSESIETQSYGAMWESIGTYLARKLPGEVYAIWLLHNRGRHGIPRAKPAVQSFRCPPGSVEESLARIHPFLILPLGSGDPGEAWLHAECVFSHSGAPTRTVLGRQADCLFFVEEAHAPGKRVKAESDQGE